MQGDSTAEEMQRKMYMMSADVNKELLATQGAMESHIRSPPETAEYIREFSEDHMFIFDEKDGDLLGGTTPKESIVKNWAVCNPNYVFGNLSEPWERKKLELMELEGELTDSMYTINWELAAKLEGGLNNPLVRQSLMEKQAALNVVQQRIHAFMKKTRAKKGKERELMVTRSIIAGTTASAEKKKSGILSNIVGGIFKK